MQSYRCDLCDGTRIDPIAERDRRGKPLRTGICRDCGLIQHLPVPSDEEVARFYAERYREEYHGEARPSSRRVMRAWRNGQRIVRRLAACWPRPMRVIEVGAGIGCTVKGLQLAGFDAEGIEPHHGFCRYGREALGAPIAQRSLFELKAEAAYDGVVLVHVIEHFTSPRRALQQIHRLLRDGGRLYIECPNAYAPFTQFARMFHYAHIYNFTPKTLLALAADCGFRLERIFTDEDDPNIEASFVKGAADGSLKAELSGHADEVLGRIVRHGFWRHVLRTRYLKARVRKLAGYAREFVTARRFERALLARLNDAG